MKKWLFFASAAILAIFAFLIFAIWSTCSGSLPSPIPTEVFPNCFPFLQYVFLFLSFASAALFLAFILTGDQETTRKGHKTS